MGTGGRRAGPTTRRGRFLTAARCMRHALHAATIAMVLRRCDHLATGRVLEFAATRYHVPCVLVGYAEWVRSNLKDATVEVHVHAAAQHDFAAAAGFTIG